MKTGGFVLVAVLLGAVSVSAQTVSSVSVPPDIIVLQKSWLILGGSSSLGGDPFRPNDEFRESLRAQRNTDIRNAVKDSESDSREATPTRYGKSPDLSWHARTTYVYQAKIRNTGAKTIRAVTWGYVFTDPDTQEELSRRRYTTKGQIRSGQDKYLSGRSTTPPTRVFNVKNARTDSMKQPTEQVVIYRIEYVDGTVWRNSTK